MAARECVLEDPSLRLQPPLTKGPMLWFNRIDSHLLGGVVGFGLVPVRNPSMAQVRIHIDAPNIAHRARGGEQVPSLGRLEH